MGDKIRMTNLPTIKPELVDIVRKIHALRTVTKKIGFITNHSVRQLLMGLSSDDLITIGEALQISGQDFEHYLKTK
jgi:hypothetical protein